MFHEFNVLVTELCIWYTVLKFHIVWTHYCEITQKSFIFANVWQSLCETKGEWVKRTRSSDAKIKDNSFTSNNINLADNQHQWFHVKNLYCFGKWASQFSARVLAKGKWFDTRRIVLKFGWYLPECLFSFLLIAKLHVC